MTLSILHQYFLMLPLLLGSYLTLSLLKLPDFSIESAFLMGALGAYFAQDCGTSIMLLSAFLSGSFVGIILVFINQSLKIPFLLAAIIMNGLLHGGSLLLLGTSVKSFSIGLAFSDFTLSAIVSVIVTIFLGLTIRSQLGYSLAIFGQNPRFFQSHPPSANFIIFMGIVIAYGYAGLGGFLFAEASGFVDVTMQYGLLLMCLTSLSLGKLLFKSTKPNIFIPVLGGFFFFVIQQSLLYLGLPMKYFNTFQACLFLSILVLKTKKQSFSLDHLGV